MKKIIAITAALVLALALAACAPSSLSVESDDTGVHAVATNGADGEANGNITIGEGYGLCVNHIVNKGSFHVKATDKSGAVVFDKDITDNIADLVPVTGEFDIWVTANGADGTVDIIAYDVEAQAQADATLPDAIKDAGSKAGMANPWSDDKTAEAAGEAAGVGNFQLPEEGMDVEGGPVHWDGYKHMELLAEADGSVGTATLTVRKGVKNPAEDVAYDTADVSGDYNEYAKTWKVQAGDWEVTCSGNEEGKTMKAIWTSDNFSYCILVKGQGGLADTYGLSDGDIATLVDAIL